MKIVIGKFSHEPFHALSKKEVSLLLKIVPSEWVKHVSSVVLSSKICKKTKLTKAVEFKSTSKQLCVYSRGLDREEIARQVLFELAAIGADFDEAHADKTSELQIVIKPYMNTFLKARV
jgi:hypothetical protein